MKSPRTLILISHGLYEPWLEILHNGQRRTWLRWPVPENMEIAHFHGTPLSRVGRNLDKIHENLRWTNRWVAYPLAIFDRLLTLPFLQYVPKVENSQLLQIEEKVFHVHFPDSYLTYRWKLLGIINFILETTDFDFVFFTTTSSLIKPSALMQVVSQFDPSMLVYAGVRPYESANFAGGNNRLLSRKSAQLLLKHRRQLDAAIIEDKAVGIFFERAGVPFIELNSYNISSMDELNSTSLLANLKSNFHIRVKSGSLSKRNDVKIMRAVFDKLNEIGEY